MLPKTNASLFAQESFDKLYLAGTGVNLKAGANIFLGQNFFIQSEIKLGYANLWNVKMADELQADISQKFGFSQINLSVGGLL